MSVYGPLPIYQHTDLVRRGYIRPLVDLGLSRSGHDGLCARRLPIAMSGFIARGHSRVLPAPVRPGRHRFECSQPRWISSRLRKFHVLALLAPSRRMRLANPSLNNRKGDVGFPVKELLHWLTRL